MEKRPPRERGIYVKYTRTGGWSRACSSLPPNFTPFHSYASTLSQAAISASIPGHQNALGRALNSPPSAAVLLSAEYASSHTRALAGGTRRTLWLCLWARPWPRTRACRPDGAGARYSSPSSSRAKSVAVLPGDMDGPRSMAARSGASSGSDAYSAGQVLGSMPRLAADAAACAVGVALAEEEGCDVDVDVDDEDDATDGDGGVSVVEGVAYADDPVERGRGGTGGTGKGDAWESKEPTVGIERAADRGVVASLARMALTVREPNMTVRGAHAV